MQRNNLLARILSYKFSLICYFTLGTSHCNPNSNKKDIRKVHPSSVKRKEGFAAGVSQCSHEQDKAVQVIVLLHGLDRNSFDFNVMKAVLQQNFPHAVILALTSVNKYTPAKGKSPTTKLPIVEQAELAYEEIKSDFKSRGKDFSTIPKRLVLVGHSQGGLRAFALIRAFGERLSKETAITIERLITIGTPWKGAPVADHLKDPDKVTALLKRFKDDLEQIEPSYSGKLLRHIFKKDIFCYKIPSCAIAYLFRKFSDIAEGDEWPIKALGVGGAADLRPGSSFINGVASALKDIVVPVTAIAGVARGFDEVFLLSSTNAARWKELDQVYAKIIGGDMHCEHDMLLPVSTQHAEGLKKKDFECLKIYGTCHGNKVGIPVKKGVSELSNAQVIQAVVDTITKTFYHEQNALNATCTGR
ncbi:esterase/lipase family protein [Candidatus Cardinium hertigii]|uniref:DUF676 domain-containing protein n=1 Tax=Candidatus Cardinium hertigii TaxID=247481 RepID=A0A2Z3LIE1_9BACT|nr:alpha/beta hydrolase [Candidatus Cardinium hertigii]AWN82295.1 hypothetical protein DK880_00998 [Candidatus Cardinium hertigii]